MINRGVSRASRLSLFAFATTAGCSSLNTQLLLDKMNSGSACPTSARASVQERVARMTFAAVADAYFDNAAVERWLDAAIANPKPIMDLYAWSIQHPHDAAAGTCPRPAAAGVCAQNGDDAFVAAVLPATLRRGDTLTNGTSVWNLPPATLCLGAPLAPQGPADCSQPGSPPSDDCPRPSPALSPNACAGERPSTGAPSMWRAQFPARTEAAETMIDEERFVANVAAVVPSLVTLRNIVDPTARDTDIQAGVVAGLAHVKRYLHARSWHRSIDRPKTAMVFSGGGGTGAFQAGFVNRLLGILQDCQASHTCDGASIDLTVGTSTGSLVGFLVDMFSLGGAKQPAARDLLRYEYTCSAANDLYCSVSEPITKVMTTVPGLVRFDGIERLIHDNWSPELATNPMELVTVSVDYESGDLYADSDQDPDDAAGQEGRVDSVLASIVEPMMADPVRGLRRADGRTIQGTFIDGGIRSGLPVLQAMQRGAERVLVVSTASIDPDPIPRPADMVKIVLRTIDLMVDQPRTDEVQQADLGAVARRMWEYNTCIKRYQVIGSDPGGAPEREEFCTRRKLRPPAAIPHPQAAAAGWLKPGSIQQVAGSWQSSWVFRSEKPVAPMIGYTFDPKGMRDLYLQGMSTFADRCSEVLELLALPDRVVHAECTAERAAAAATAEQARFADFNQCEAKTKQPRRLCDSQ